LPVRRAAQVSALGVDDEDSFRVPHYPNAILLLELSIDAKPEIGWIADAKDGLGLEQGARKEEPQKHQEVDRQKPDDGGAYDPAPGGDELRLRLIFEKKVGHSGATPRRLLGLGWPSGRLPVGASARGSDGLLALGRSLCHSSPWLVNPCNPLL